MLFEPNEIRTSEEQLEKIFEQLKEPACLLGGWATYHVVNKSFEGRAGSTYTKKRALSHSRFEGSKWLGH